jgi:GT2 family glycosyltransferase
MSGIPTSIVAGVVLFENTPQQLRRLGRSLKQNSAHPDCPPFTVVFLDNSPTDALQALVREEFPEAAYEWSGKNLGFGRAHNVLMARAFAGEGVAAYVCVNPDAVLHPACLAEMMAEYRRSARPGLVEAAQFPDEHPKVYDPVTHQTPWCSGCVLLLSRDLYREVGGYDDHFFMYCEDVDLSWRARAHGFDTRIAPRALAHHYVGDRPPSPTGDQRLLRSGIYLALKYGDARIAEAWLDEYARRGGKDFTPPTPPEPTEAMRRVADFSHLFHMAEARW